MHKKFAHLCFFAAVGAVATNAASAATVLNDAFTSGTNPGWTATTNLLPPGGTTGVTLTVANDATLGGGNALSFATVSNNRAILRALSSDVSLAIGNSITFSFDYRFTADPASVTQGFYFGFVDSDASLTGYRASTNPGAAAATGGRLTSQPTGTNHGAAYATFDHNTDAQHVAFTLTRTAADAMNLSVAWTGFATAPTASIAATLFTFDSVFIGFGGMSGTALIDNVLVTTTAAVPEPASTASLAAALALGCALAGRRARRV